MGDYGRAAVALLLTYLAFGAMLAVLAVWLCMPPFHRWRQQVPLALAGLLLGAFLSAAAGFSLTMGEFLPYVGGWGGLELREFGGGDLTWQSYLISFLLVFSVVGAMVGAASGVVAWALGFLRYP